jgi:predicted transcriptional regulator
MSKKDKLILQNAINCSDILPRGQKNVLNIICSSDYPVSAKHIEKLIGLTKQTVNFSIKSLLSRNFIIREKDGVFVYKANQDRVTELIDRYKATLNKHQKTTDLL